MSCVKRAAGSGRFVQNSDQAFNDVVNIGKVAHHFSVIEHINGVPLLYSFGEQKECHVGPPPRAIHGKET